jgi:hypothetical protein
MLENSINGLSSDEKTESFIVRTNEEYSIVLQDEKLFYFSIRKKKIVRHDTSSGQYKIHEKLSKYLSQGCKKKPISNFISQKINRARTGEKLSDTIKTPTENRVKRRKEKYAKNRKRSFKK